VTPQRQRHTHAAAFVALVVASVLVAGACGGSNKVGSDKLKNFKSEGGQGALGGATTTVAPVTTAAPARTTAPPTTAKTTATTKAPTTTAAPATTTPASITVKIQGDSQGNAFEPSNTRVFQNATVRFQNVDSVAHQVKARNGEFSSPNLPPGGTWDFKATLPPAQYEYTDSARPYAVGYLEVLAR
jgi:plastocyanin